MIQHLFKSCKFYSIVVIYFALVTLTSCQGDASIIDPQSILEFSIDDTEYNYISSGNYSFDTSTFRIPFSVTEKIGSTYDGAYLIQKDRLLLIDRVASEINVINREGQIINSFIPPSPGIDRYTYIKSVDYNPLTRELYVYGSDWEIDVFDVSGEFLRSLPVDDLILDFESIGTDSLIEDISLRSLSIHEKRMKFRFESKAEKIRFSPYSIPGHPEPYLITFYSDFNHLGDDLYHRMPLQDTIFKIVGTKSFPYATFSLKNNNRFSEVSTIKSTNDVYSLLLSEESPIPVWAALGGEHNHLLLGNINYKSNHYFTLNNQLGTIIPLSQYFYSSGLPLKAPQAYSDGTLFSQLFTYEFEYLMKAKNSNYSKEKIELELKSLISKNGDMDGIIVVVASI